MKGVSKSLAYSESAGWTSEILWETWFVLSEGRGTGDIWGPISDDDQEKQKSWTVLLRHHTRMNTGVSTASKPHFSADIPVKRVNHVSWPCWGTIAEDDEGRHSSCCLWSWLFKATWLLCWLGLSQINRADHRLNSTVNKHILFSHWDRTFPAFTMPPHWNNDNVVGYEDAASSSSHTNAPPKLEPDSREKPIPPHRCSSCTTPGLKAC